MKTSNKNANAESENGGNVEQDVRQKSAENSAGKSAEGTAKEAGGKETGNTEQGNAGMEPTLLRASVDNTIKNHVIIALAFGLVPVPLFDVALLVGNQVAMVNNVSKLYDTPFEEHRAKSIIISLLSGSAPVGGIVILSTGAKAIPGIGSLVGSGIVAFIGGALTYATGKVFAKHFESGATLLDFDSKKMRDFFNKQFRVGRKVAAKEAEEVKDAKEAAAA